MKKLTSLAAMAILLAPALAEAQQHRPGDRPPGQQRPPAGGHHGGPGGPGGSPGRPNPGQPGVRPPTPRPPIVRPPNPRPPVARPPHRPGIGRPPQFRPIHRPSFRYPPGYRYQRWSIGGLLPLLFLSNNYYYDGWYDLGLGAPPRGYRWVRYGPDLLLVNLRTRRVVDVIYGAFY